jgi:hypothetical protein
LFALTDYIFHLKIIEGSDRKIVEREREREGRERERGE